MTSEDGRRKPADVIDALGHAAQECDIVNLSIGQPDPSCSIEFSLCKTARRVVESGTIVVAAAGNKNKKSTKIRCPAKVEPVISVGASVVECQGDPDFEGEWEHPRGSYSIKKNTDDEEYWDNFPVDDFPYGPFCGQRGCTPSAICMENNYEKGWRGNVEDAPTILAPHHNPSLVVDQNEESQPMLRQGSSFAAPVVTGCLAGILGDLYQQGIHPEPAEVKDNVWSMGDEINGSDTLRFNARWTYDALLKS